MRKIPLYQALARHIAWQPTESYLDQRQKEIAELVSMLPSGSGWDMGTKIDMERSREDRIVLYGEFHHMDENGFYDGWTAHTITVTPSLADGLRIKVSGPNRNDVKDDLHERFDIALNELVWPFHYDLHNGFVVEGRDGEPYEIVYHQASTVWDVFGYTPLVRVYSSSGI